MNSSFCLNTLLLLHALFGAKRSSKQALIVGAPLSKGHRGTVRIGAPDFAFGHASCYRLEIGQRHSESFDFATPPS